MNKIKTLFLAANPKGTQALQLDGEIREIAAKIRASEYRDSIDLVSAWAVRPDDLLQLLNQHKPQIVHFSGHGSGRGEIILDDNQGRSKSVSPAALKALFSTLKDNIRLVILNACYSRNQAEAITQMIDCVIGMNEEIGDEAAITFAASFYRAIGFGRSVKESFDQGITSLLLEGIPEEHTPELLTKEGVSPSDIYLVDRNSLRADITQNKRALRIAMLESFSREDIAILCKDIEEELRKDGKDLGVSLDIVTGNTRLEIQILDLIEYLENRGLLDYLIREVQKSRRDLMR